MQDSKGRTWKEKHTLSRGSRVQTSTTPSLLSGSAFLLGPVRLQEEIGKASQGGIYGTSQRRSHPKMGSPVTPPSSRHPQYP